MASSINERFLDFQIAQQIRWIRVQNRDVQEALNILNRVDGQLELALRRAGIGDAPYTQARLVALKAQVTNLLGAMHGELDPVLTQNVIDAAEAAAKVEEQLFRQELPAGLDVTTPNLGVLQQAATLRPFNGAVMAEWVSQLKTADLQRTWGHILDGIISGTTTDEIIRGLVGTEALNYMDGVRQVTRRGTEALVRTSINHATNQGRQMVWEANTNVVGSVRWVSTLDTRTTPICQHRDGRVGPVTEEGTPPEGASVLDPPMARPPAHPNCRSTTVAVTKSWRELGFDMDEMDPGTRASMDGQVPANMTYFEWLAKQSEAVQKDVLGKTRYDMWHRDGIKPDRFINDKGQTLTIKQIRDLPPLPVSKLAFGIDSYKIVGKEGDFTYALNKIPLWKPKPVTSVKDAYEYDRGLYDDIRELSITHDSVRTRETVKLNELVGLQSTVRIENLRPILEKWDAGKALEKPPTVFRLPDGKLVLKDGNHRVNAAMANGLKEMAFEVIEFAAIEKKGPTITRLTEFNPGDNQLSWFSWKKDKQLQDYFQQLDATDFGLKEWPAIGNLKSVVDQDIATAIGRVAVEAGRGADKFALERAKFDLKETLWSKRGLDGKLLHAEPVPLKIADVFDLTDFEKARLSSNNLNKFEYLRYLDPKEFGLKYWPDMGTLAKAAPGDRAGILGDMRMIVINNAPGGKPKRYITNLQKRIDRIVNPPAPVVIKKQAPAPAVKDPGAVTTSKDNTQPAPFKVGTGQKLLKDYPALERHMQKAYDVMPNWVLNEIKDVTRPTMTKNTRAFYSPWNGELHMSTSNGADVWVHEMFHALDFKYRYKGQAVTDRRLTDKTDSLDWNTDDPTLNRLAQQTRLEFKNRDSKGVGRYTHNKDGDYWLGDWMNNYEGRKYDFDIETSSEYITMGAQNYAQAKMTGPNAFENMRNTMRVRQPAMLEFLDYIWTRFD